MTCYAESKDGIHWSKPELGLFEFGGSKRNNIVWSGVGTHNFAPFKDANPSCKPEQRYKALALGNIGLLAFQSPDGVHWSLVQNEPVITKGAFDSQNLAFWDSTRLVTSSFTVVFATMCGTSYVDRRRISRIGPMPSIWNTPARPKNTSTRTRSRRTIEPPTSSSAFPSGSCQAEKRWICPRTTTGSRTACL